MQTWRQKAGKPVTVIGKRHGLPLVIYVGKPRSRGVWAWLKRMLFA